MCYWCKIKCVDFITANVGTKKPALFHLIKPLYDTGRAAI